MKLHALWVTAIVLGLGGCGQQEQPESSQAASEEAAGVAESAMQDAGKPMAEVDQAFIDHMHAHAEQLDELMFALADNDLDGALTPAYWLSRHETVQGIPEAWQQYVIDMRAAAARVGASRDLETAKAAAAEITAHCQACHAAAGVSALQ